MLPLQALLNLAIASSGRSSDEIVWVVTLQFAVLVSGCSERSVWKRIAWIIFQNLKRCALDSVFL